MIGIVIAHYVWLPVPILPVLVGMVFVTLLLYKQAHAQSVAILVCCLLLGMCVMQYHQQTSEHASTESRFDRSRSFFLEQREQLLQRYQDGGLDGDAYAVVAAMSLGDKTALTREVRSMYSVSGASHVLALSGLHLGIIYMLLSLLLPRRRWPAVSQLLSILVVWAFVLLVGMPVSAVRSAVMLTIYGILSIGHRNKMSVNVLAFTALVMLLWNPAWLFDVGFQMSFMAVWAILLFVPVFTGVFSDKYYMEHPWVAKGWGMVAVSMAAQLGVAPLIAYYFAQFSTCFLLTNFLVVPAAFLILCLSVVVLLFPSLAYLLLYIVQGLNAALDAIANLPGASIGNLHPTILQVVFIYVLIVCCYLLIERIKPIMGWTPWR
ncbi:competence protein ComEC [Xylanibacter ruminicola]|uniref:Competence protein ComEC n=2 Tax=Xylanibacter ruminicola TaxID=839 RepID=A0A1H3X2N2_XYLRU|nr:competence protein ComEC [Xylanibacter ruminicola]